MDDLPKCCRIKRLQNRIQADELAKLLGTCPLNIVAFEHGWPADDSLREKMNRWLEQPNPWQPVLP